MWLVLGGMCICVVYVGDDSGGLWSGLGRVGVVAEVCQSTLMTDCNLLPPYSSNCCYFGGHNIDSGQMGELCGGSEREIGECKQRNMKIDLQR